MRYGDGRCAAAWFTGCGRTAGPAPRPRRRRGPAGRDRCTGWRLAGRGRPCRSTNATFPRGRRPRRGSSFTRRRASKAVVSVTCGVPGCRRRAHAGRLFPGQRVQAQEPAVEADAAAARRRRRDLLRRRLREDDGHRAPRPSGAGGRGRPTGRGTPRTIRDCSSPSRRSACRCCTSCTSCTRSGTRT